MSKTAKNASSEIFTMRITKDLKEKLNALAKKGKYGNTASSVIRDLIEIASKN